eukprot:UN2840
MPMEDPVPTTRSSSISTVWVLVVVRLKTILRTAMSHSYSASASLWTPCADAGEARLDSESTDTACVNAREASLNAESPTNLLPPSVRCGV